MTTTSKIEHERGLAQFAGLKVRLRSLDYFRDEVPRCRANGQEIIEQLAALRPSGNRWEDERVRAEWEEKLDEACDEYNAAFRKLCWELEDSHFV